MVDERLGFDGLTSLGQLWSGALGLEQSDSTLAKSAHCPAISQLSATIMIPLKFLGLVLAAGACTATAHKSLSNLYDACELTLDHSRYDLCPIFNDRGQDGIVRVRAEISPNTQAYYEISFGGPLSARIEEEVEPKVRPGDRERCNASRTTVG